LLPSPYKRAQTFYLNTWREIASGPTLDWDSREHSFEFPASIRLASSMFLEVKLPACGSGNWIANAGQHLIRSMKIKSGSRTPVHYDDYAVILRDYLASLSNEAHACFCDAYLGGFQEGGSETSTARTLYIPILLPQSHFLHREQRNSRSGFGVLPCNFDNNKLEICVTLCPSTYLTVDGSNAASLVGSLRWCIREVQMSEANMVRYESSRGSFSIISRQFTKVGSGADWSYVAANTLERVTFQRLTGSVTEFQILAVKVDDASEDVQYLEKMQQPDVLRLIVDSITVREYTDKSRGVLELYKQGFIHNKVADNCARICFGSHVSSRDYTGSFNMQNTSNLRIEMQFPENVKYQIRAVRLDNLTIDSDGTLRSSLE
jgi:hypothetical protein